MSSASPVPGAPAFGESVPGAGEHPGAVAPAPGVVQMNTMGGAAVAPAAALMPASAPGVVLGVPVGSTAVPPSRQMGMINFAGAMYRPDAGLVPSKVKKNRAVSIYLCLAREQEGADWLRDGQPTK